LCVWIFACPDGGRRPPPGGLPYGVKHCVVIRGIREIRGYDQRSLAALASPAAAFRWWIFCRTSAGRSNTSSFGVTAVSESLKADAYASPADMRQIAVIPNVLECGL